MVKRKFRRKPLILEASQWMNHGDDPDVSPLIVQDEEDVCLQCRCPFKEHGQIETLEGFEVVCPGDWIITGVKGEKYPCKPDIFEEIYEPVDEEPLEDTPSLKVRAYLSAPIRGEKGSNASQRDIDRNIVLGKKLGAHLRRYFGELLDLYVPHDQDDLIQIFWRDGKLTAWDIVEGDCKIVEKRDLLLVWTPSGFISSGMKREIKTAEKSNIPIIEFEEFNNEVARKILREISKIILERDN